MAQKLGLVVLVTCMLPQAIAAQDAERSRYERACDGGDLDACVTAGLLYEAARGAARDLARAAALYERACEGGARRGCMSLGLMYETGTGVNRDPERAVELYRSGCDRGESMACDRIRSLEATGQVAAASQTAIYGRVADAQSERALGEAIVQVPSLGVHAITDAGGRFELADVPRGRYVLRVERLGYAPYEREITVPGSPELLIILREAEIGDPTAPGRVVGRVAEDGRDRAISDVEVSVLGQPAVRTLSNNQGRFTLRDVRPGLVRVRFEHLGYEARTAALVLQPARTVEIAATLATQAIELEPIQVTVRSSFLVDNGFYRREARGLGSHFDRQDLDRIDPIDVSDLLWSVPGVRVRYGAGNRAYATGRFRCVMPMYVDGVRWPDNDLNDLPAEWLEAVEVYNGVGTPIRYRAFGNDCGVVLIWTRR